MNKTEGLIAAPLTAFHPDGNVNLDIIPAYASFLCAGGVIGVFVNGTTGEGLSLTLAERMVLAEQWMKATPPDFKVIIHVSHTCPLSAGELARHAERIGATGIGEMGPVFYRPNTVEALADAAAQTAAQVPDLPYYYYHIPSMNGVGFPMIDFLQVAAPRIGNLAGIKYTHEDLVDYDRCLAFKDGAYDILYGRDETLLSALILGCRGAVGSTYNIMAPLYTRLRQAFTDGNLDEAHRYQRLSMEVIRLLIETSCFNAAMKESLRVLGLDLGGVRSPLGDIRPEEKTHLQNRLEKIGFRDFANRGIERDEV
jgi:N-acetylneuraminate lyase